MDLNEDLVSKLLAHGGGRQFFASCLLQLDPKELKVCRQVCTSWDKFIKEEIWDTFYGKSRLKRRLVDMWKNTDPNLTTVVWRIPGEVESLFSNDTHIFCGHQPDQPDQDGLVTAVYSLESAAWVKDLVPSVERPDNCRRFTKYEIPLAGGNGVVAAISWNRVATLWSSDGPAVLLQH